MPKKDSKRKEKMFNFRGDEKIESKVHEVMKSENLTQSDAIRHMIDSYGEKENVVTKQKKLSRALFLNNFYNAINKIPVEYRSELLNLVEVQKCQI